MDPEGATTARSTATAAVNDDAGGARGGRLNRRPVRVNSHRDMLPALQEALAELQNPYVLMLEQSTGLPREKVISRVLDDLFTLAFSALLRTRRCPGALPGHRPWEWSALQHHRYVVGRSFGVVAAFSDLFLCLRSGLPDVPECFGGSDRAKRSVCELASRLCSS